MAAEREYETALTVYTPQQIDLIRNNLAPDVSEDDFALFLEVCKGTGLNPFRRQIYAIGRKSKTKDAQGHDAWVTKMTIQTGIDGYRLIAARTRQLAGIDDATYDRDDDEHPNRASVTVWRMVDGQRVAFTATARWREYAQYKDEYANGNKTGAKVPSEMWGKMPYLMLAKCAEALALRKAFPEELSGVYTADEMDQADNTPPARVVEQSQDASTTTRATQPAKPTQKLWGELQARATKAGKVKNLGEFESVVKRITGKAMRDCSMADYNGVIASLANQPEPAQDAEVAYTEEDADGHDLHELPVGTRGD